MRKHLGWIALDIDGTITDETHRAPLEVVQFLHSLNEKGWEIAFITGRTYSFAHRVIKDFDFPFYLAIQNGADILHMPSQVLISRYYLDAEVIPVLCQAYQGEKEDFLIYTGYERGDFCYYRPDRYSLSLLKHLDKIMALSPEPWKPLKDFQFEKGISFPLAKCLGTLPAMQRINALLKPFADVNATLIRDPLSDGEIYLNLVTTKHATKGRALRTIQEIVGDGGPIIAAGDDLNDISMLEIADVKIVMAQAPPVMHAMATIIARPGKQHPIIAALRQATEQ
jgi:hydroxymethylpyrimidine pyrophosphatase-like HAD family hydrolase